MTSTTAAALLHNTAARVTLGNSPTHAVPVTLARQLRPLLESNTSLATFTVHTQFTPPESLRLLLLGASRCRSLQLVRLVGGISVLQSRMISSALAHFAFTCKSPRAVTALRARRSPAERRPHTPEVEGLQKARKRFQPTAAVGEPGAKSPVAPTVTEDEGGAPWLCGVKRPSEACQPGGYCRLHSPACCNAWSARASHSRRSWLTGVHMVLDLHHIDDIVTGILLKGLERSERIVRLDVNVSPTSQAVMRAATRMLSHANSIVVRNANRAGHLLSRNLPPRGVFVHNAQDRSADTPPPYASPSSPAAAMGVPPASQEMSTKGSCQPPPRPYSPPRLLSVVSEPLPLRPPVLNTRHRFLYKGKSDVCQTPICIANSSEKNDRFLCRDETGRDVTCRTPDEHLEPGTPKPSLDEEFHKACDDSSVQLTPRNPLEATQPSPSPLSRRTPLTPPQQPPSPRAQLIQQTRYLRGCVRDINAVVVRYQVVSRESIRRLVADMQLLEGQLEKGITTKLTDMMMSLTELESQDG